ncbi:MAG: YCF48-related protein [Bacteroidota bacterium]|nr:YCF48-related protein [Bacteroidota bacterium]
MKKYVLLLMFLLSAILLNSKIIFSQGFNSIDTPDGVNVVAVGDNGLIFRSTNTGSTWSSFTIPSVNFKDAVSFNNNVWIAGDNGKVYKTQIINTAITAYSTGVTNTLRSISFIDGNLGFVCGDDGIIFKTVNGGLNWSSSSTGITNVDLNSISFLDAQKGIVTGKNGSVYMTGNGGSSWTPEPVGTSRNLIKVKYFSDGIALSGEYGILYVKPTGSSWSPVNTRIVTDINGVTGTGINDVHVCGGGGFIRNNKNGDSRFYTFEANPMIANLVDIFYYDSNIGFAVSSMNTAIIKTTDAGANWSLTSGTAMTYQWQTKLSAVGGIGNNLCQHPSDRNSVFVAFNSTVYVSRDRAETWTEIATIPNGGAHSFYVSPLDTNIWVAAISSSPDRISKTTDYGVTWTTSISGNFSNYGQPLEMDQNNPSVFYFAPDNGGFFKSTDNGSTFTEISNNYPFRSPCDILVMWDSSNVVFVADGVTGSEFAKIFKSVNGGVNWNLVKIVSSSEIPSMCNSVFEKNKVYATEWPGASFHRSQNYGNGWDVVFTSNFSGWGSGICFEDPNVIIVGSYGSESSFTYDGENFTEVNSLNYAGAGMLVPDKNLILSMQTADLFKLKVTYTVLTAVNENIISSNIPNDFKLHQNYPNPFNPSTTIKFDVPNSGNISLKLYSQLGKEVASLIDGVRNAGTYEILFDASALASGVYFYKIISDRTALTKKMLLVK